MVAAGIRVDLGANNTGGIKTTAVTNTGAGIMAP